MADPSNHYKLSPKCVVPTSNLSSLGSPLRANDCVMFEVLTNHLFLLYAAQVILRELQKLSAMVSVCPYLSVTANTLQSYLYIVVHYTLAVTQPTSLYAHTHSTAYTVQIISLYGTSCSTHTQTHAHTHTNTCVRTHTHTQLLALFLLYSYLLHVQFMSLRPCTTTSHTSLHSYWGHFHSVTIVNTWRIVHTESPPIHLLHS